MNQITEKQIQTVEDNQPNMPEVIDTGAAMISMIERIAMDPNLPIERLQKMMEMQETWEDRKAKKEFSTALSMAKSEMVPVVTNQKNKQTNSKYADLCAIDLAITPIITSHGFTPSFYPVKSDLEKHYGVGCTLSHNAGHEKEYSIDIPVDNAGIKGTVNKTAPHALSSSMTYGRRILKTMIFDLATTDDDGNGAGNGVLIDEDHLKEIRLMIEDTGTDISAFCNYFKIDSLVDLPLSKLDDAITSLNIKKAKNNG